MRRLRPLSALAPLVWSALGCHQVKHNTDVPLVHEYRTAPTGEARFDNAPEAALAAPPRKKEFKPSLGAAGSGSPGSFGGSQQN